MPPETKLHQVQYFGGGALDGHHELCDGSLPMEIRIPVRSDYLHVYQLAWQDTEKGAGYKFCGWRKRG